MGGLSLWHLILVSILLLIPVGVAAVAVSFNRGASALSRKSFTIRVLGLFFALVVIGGFIGAATMPTTEGNGQPLNAVLGLAWMICIPYWAASRLRDMGQPKKRAIITGIPLVGLFYTIYLMIAARTPAAGATA